MKLNLIVLRSKDMEALADFYSALLGKTLTKHRHGNGPDHFGTEVDGLVFELYPKRHEQDDTSCMRMGFKTDSINEVLLRIKKFQVEYISGPTDSPWGKRLVMDDPEGHRIELTESSTSSE